MSSTFHHHQAPGWQPTCCLLSLPATEMTRKTRTVHPKRSCPDTMENNPHNVWLQAQPGSSRVCGATLFLCSLQEFPTREPHSTEGSKAKAADQATREHNGPPEMVQLGRDEASDPVHGEHQPLNAVRTFWGIWARHAFFCLNQIISVPKTHRGRSLNAKALNPWVF